MNRVENLISNASIKKGMDVVKAIEASGYEAYIVGGTPRDILLGVDTHDVDIATNCPIDVLRQKFMVYEIGKSSKFKAAILIFNNIHFDVVQFRSDGEYTDGRHPDTTSLAASISEDVKRRDFTINALVMLSDGSIVDYVNGMADLRQKLIRTVGDPEKRFKEDHLRMIRAARFAAKAGFDIEKNTRKAIIHLSNSIKDVAPERIRMEMIKSAEGTGKEFAKFIWLLDKLRILSKILPEVHTLKYYKHQINHHPEGITVMDHTLACVSMIEAGKPLVKIAALLHDIGKPLSYSEDDGKPHFYRHEVFGIPIAEEICKRLTFASYETDVIKFVVQNHMKFHKILEMKPSKIAKLVLHDHFPILKEVAWADEFCRGETFMYYGEFDKKLARANEIIQKWKNRVHMGTRTKVIDGHLVMKITGLPAGPKLGQIINTVEECIIDRNIDPQSTDVIDLILEVYNAFNNTEKLEV